MNRIGVMPCRHDAAFFEMLRKRVALPATDDIEMIGMAKAGALDRPNQW